MANQIAAGEVVERPASVIKELVENSIDAGAERIRIEIELGGRRLMRITDDGEGMARDDAILAFERHATSKIEVQEDLAKIETLGFRGEALASIASVSKIELLSNMSEEGEATRIFIEGGKLIDVKGAARPIGTTIAVRDLFFNTPARRKFMRSQATENYHITGTITHYALANPKIAFTLVNNGREKIRVSPARNLRERAYQLFGSKMIESLLLVKGGREFIANVSGFISAPRERRTTRDSQYFFINGRFVKDKLIGDGLLEGFRSVLPHGVYPVAFLFLEIPLEEVDVNVHPAKTEVRFRRAQAIKDVIAEAVKDTLRNAGVAGRTDFETFSGETAKNRLDETQQTIERESEMTLAQVHGQNMAATSETQARQRAIEFEIPADSQDFESIATDRAESKTETKIENLDPQSEPLKSETPSFSSENAINTTNYKQMPPVDSAASVPQPVEVEEVSASKIRPIAQLHESFIVAFDDEGLLLIDQHVAHERILFDKFRKLETERKIESQNLLVPETFDLTPAQEAGYEEIKADLEACGFGLVKLSGRTLAINSIPTDLPPVEVRNVFAEILDTIEKENRGDVKKTFRDDIAASMACKAAVKINMKLSPEKMSWMIDRLLVTSSPTTCPHGRPVILRLSMKDIERRFHRS